MSWRRTAVALLVGWFLGALMAVGAYEDGHVTPDHLQERAESVEWILNADPEELERLAAHAPGGDA